MKTVILVLDVNDFGNGRRIVERLENREFQTEKEIIDAVDEENDHNPDGVAFNIYELTDFMDLCNDQVFDIENSWVGYVRVPDDLKL